MSFCVRVVFSSAVFHAAHLTRLIWTSISPALAHVAHAQLAAAGHACQRGPGRGAESAQEKQAWGGSCSLGCGPGGSQGAAQAGQTRCGPQLARSPGAGMAQAGGGAAGPIRATSPGGARRRGAGGPVRATGPGGSEHARPGARTQPKLRRLPSKRPNLHRREIDGPD